MSVFYKSKILSQPTETMAYGGEVKPRKMEEGGGTFYDPGFGEYNPATGYFEATPEFKAEQARLDAAMATGGEQGAYTGYTGGYYGGGGGEGGAGDTNFSDQYLQYMSNQYDRNGNLKTDTSAADAAADAAAAAAANAATLADFNERFAGGTLTPEEIQQLINDGMSEEQVLTLIGNYQLNEDQLGQLYNQGLLTEEQIAQILGQVEEAAAEEGEILSEDRVEELVASGGYTQEEIAEMIAAQSADLSGYATTEQLAGLEGQFQNFLTPEQLEGYVTSDQLAEATANDYDDVIEGLTTQLSDLETKYQDVTDQYEADAVNQQISDTKDELSSFFAGAVNTGPQTGSTSQFDSGTSFLPGGSPMANLIGGQREGAGQDAFNSYLKTFTPSYASYEEPKSLEDYAQGSNPFMGAQYNNPFTGGYNMGGQVSNGIMDLTNFDTNVQPFQNAFRPNKPRN